MGIYQSKSSAYVLKSTISAKLLHDALKRGSILGGSGAIILLFSGIFLPISLLKILGIPIFFMGIILIAIGFLPYRQLNKVQLHPYEIHCEDNKLTFHKEGKALFTMSVCSIKNAHYLEKGPLNGIGIWLKRPINEKVRVVQPHFDFAAFVADSKQRFEGCDLFLPYFTKRTHNELIDHLYNFDVDSNSKDTFGLEPTIKDPLE